MAAALIRKGKGTNIKKACALVEKTDNAIRGLCKQYGIGVLHAWLADRDISAGFDDGETERRSNAGAGPAGQSQSSSG
ncbi:hypothetical protein EHI45_24030 [Rhizobium leguminosarum]|uniref:hypothetical protein n=1 Tax=Rhizobium leguminosarum TaxID=384 RepID=UPI000FEC3107|nr:hypothetical protein [Rhizobium leguminosarum]RWX08348.1 hypothetical protein EHI45_24030 [Rhizobium leguminosarum]UIJ82924.1 hypothetical protein LZK78_26995 [Rhizobium leguminosarum]